MLMGKYGVLNFNDFYRGVFSTAILLWYGIRRRVTSCLVVTHAWPEYKRSAVRGRPGIMVGE
jgi:hypothetical protein